MADWPLRDRIAFVGVGTTNYGVFPETDAFGLGMEALSEACADAGIGLADIDGLVANRIPYERFAEMSGIRPRFTVPTPGEGRFAGGSLQLAVNAIASGAADTVALVYGNNGKSAGVRYGGEDGQWPWSPWGLTSPGALHALMFRRHQIEFGTQSEDLAAIAVAFRKHAATNPKAVMKKPITVEDHQNSRMICEPLHLLDYCLINDGGVALIVTSAERARDLRKPPVYLSGFARQDTFDVASYARTDYWFPALRKIGQQVYEGSGIGRDALSGLMIYDNFSPTVVFTLEGLGFCEQGEGGAFVRDGTLEHGRGRWPTNTNGGHLSESYMQGWALMVEAVRQCRREANLQIPDCEAIQYACAANILTTAILRRA